MKIKKEKKSKKINISKLLATIISSRDIAEVLEDAIKKINTNSIVLDFSSVKFVSRSAAHALLLLKEKLETRASNKKEISFINADNNVSEMFRVVAANRALPKNKKTDFNPEKVDISSLFKQATV